MKKVLSVFLIFAMCMGLCACGNTNGSEENSVDVNDFNTENAIEITTDNYWRYMSTDITKEERGDSFYYDDMSRTLYERIEIVANLEGDSTQYKYQDVCLTIEFYGEYFGVHRGIEYYQYVPNLGFDLVQEPITLSGTITVQLDENGIGSGSYILTPQTEYYLDAEMVSFVTEVVSISGTIVPV